LVADDIVALHPFGDAVLAHPGPPVMTVPAGAEYKGIAGRELGRLDDEAWINVPVVPAAAPVRGVVLLDAKPTGARPRADVHPLELMPHLLSIPGHSARARFDALADLATRSAVLGLTARSASPDDLCAAVRAALAPSPGR
jgi:hypothetical protein